MTGLPGGFLGPISWQEAAVPHQFLGQFRSNYQRNYFEEQGISWQGINRPNLAGRLSAIVESQLRFSHVQLVQTDTQ
jgi:hypothetical protein